MKSESCFLTSFIKRGLVSFLSDRSRPDVFDFVPYSTICIFLRFLADEFKLPEGS